MSDTVREPDVKEVYIEVEPPVTADIFEAEVIPPVKGQYLDQTERQRLKGIAELQGFVRGAVVVKRSHYPHARAIPNNWGIVMDTQMWEYDWANKIFAPIKVQWIENGSESHEWNDDLIMVHYAPEKEDLELIRSGE